MLSNRYVRTILISRVLLQLGIWIRNFAILLYVAEVTQNNPQYISLISVAEYAPIFVFAIIGGTFADRWQPKRTMVGCDWLSAVSILLVLFALHSGSWLVLLLGTLVSASLSQFSQPSAMKLYKNHVSAEHLQSVMAMNQSLIAIFMVLGPMIGTFIYLHYGMQVSLIVTFVTFCGSALVLSSLPRDQQESQATANTHLLNEMMAGIRYLWTNQALRTLSATFAVTGLAAGIIQPLALFITVENLGQDKQFLQWLLMVNGAAMLLGGILIMGIAKKVKPQLLLAVGLLVTACSTVAIGASHSTVLTIMLQVISGLFYPCIQVGIQTMIMKNTEGAFLGRVSGAIMPIFMGMMVIGMSSSGYLKNGLTLFPVYLISGVLLVMGALFLSPLRQPKSLAN
ncbi:MFS transporter [Paenibacillus marchantiophytorum]|uniref:MFS transporter n=1 Tax=Paenibacillus marchantiophytorum TaxID=1619310 RepID=A0ABQ1F7Z8_9BACL|nr:MFS transporter [Paenibacillus marchantiophytorum]GGA02936.1 MFS transporter [Paenibacillus marchantiophytorum]